MHFNNCSNIFSCFSQFYGHHSQDGQQLQVALLRDTCIFDQITNLTVVKQLL